MNTLETYKLLLAHYKTIGININSIKVRNRAIAIHYAMPLHAMELHFKQATMEAHNQTQLRWYYGASTVQSMSIEANEVRISANITDLLDLQETIFSFYSIEQLYRLYNLEPPAKEDQANTDWVAVNN